MFISKSQVKSTVGASSFLGPGLTVASIVFVALLIPSQSVVANIDRSDGRALGVGALWPSELSMRLWVNDMTGVEASLFVNTTSAHSTIGITGGALQKVLDMRVLDPYIIGRASLLFTQASQLGEFSSKALFAISGAFAFELSPSKALSLSIEGGVATLLGTPIDVINAFSGPSIRIAAHVYF